MNAGTSTQPTPRVRDRSEAVGDVACFADSLGRALRAAQRVLLTGPIDPDGDSIGACLALARGLRRRYPSLTVHVAGDPGYRYAWLAGAEGMLPDDAVTPDYDLVVVMDGDRHRLEPPVAGAFAAARVTVIIDHHGSTGADGYDLHLLDPTAASTCQMVYPLLRLWGVPIDKELAELLYTGIIFDTGGFRHSNASPATHRLAARLLELGIDHASICIRVLSERSPSGLSLLGDVLQRAELRAGGGVAVGAVRRATFDALGAAPEDLEGIVDALLHQRGVEVACLFIERAPGRVKLSLRSRKTVDVAAIAGQLGPGGGGHARAAGVLLREDFEAAWPRVTTALERIVGPQLA